MAYNEEQVRGLADSLLAAFDAARDGVGIDDVDEGVAVMTNLAACAEEIKDSDAFALHLISQLAGRLGDRRVDEAGPNPA